MLVQDFGHVAKPFVVPVVVVVGAEAGNTLSAIVWEAYVWDARCEAEGKRRLDIRRICCGRRSDGSTDDSAVRKRVTQVGKKCGADGPGSVHRQVSAGRVRRGSRNAGNSQTREQTARLLLRH